MPAAPSMGVYAKLGTGATSTVDEPFEFISESLGKEQSVVYPDGVRGDLSRIIERGRQGYCRDGYAPH